MTKYNFSKNLALDALEIFIKMNISSGKTETAYYYIDQWNKLRK
jgi:hypothetical protein